MSTASRLFDVSGQICVVTGGASGIGLACAEALAENGAKVILMDINAQLLDQTVSSLTGQGFEVRGEIVDVSNHASVANAFQNTINHYGRLDVVFANAGIDAGPGFLGLQGERLKEGALENLDHLNWQRVMAINLNGVLHCLQESAKYMKPQGSGKIVVTTSIASLRSVAWVGTPYLAAKAAGSHLMRQAALELAKYNIQVNAIAPGPFATNIADGHAGLPEVRELLEAGNPQHRVAKTSEIKGVALLLASAASSFMTGSEIVVDGGAILGQAD
ncbi:SDR family NAD(P)-dependent oxidoreductase [Pseudomonas putida]|uniref:SDR family NAD(P)-dependent oxidoreductase n=1 Tax=Pseudomonas putida TaxID=303 RepID=UPI00226EBD48|nr:SDR family NAD(P)-dependent oxidoreductase [Pseudomonas putida]WAB99241.1 SDR family NAD(P)-dependent oxidoreductase [Pseudomonas putida]